MCLAACSGKSPEAPRIVLPGDTALRLQIASAEVRRGGGLAELVPLAEQGAPASRALALRALGRIGGAQALEVLRGALGDADAGVAAAAAGALGLAASLDELDAAATAALTTALLAALPRTGARAPLVLEALGRAADASAQPILAAELGREPARAEAAAIALGRHGRRKILLQAAAREALAVATRHAAPAVRYAAVWALGREQLSAAPGAAPGSPDATGAAGAAPAAAATAAAAEDAMAAALIARLADEGPEIRAQAIAALARRKHAPAARQSLEARLADPDWRVAVEAVRALTGEPSDGLMRAAAARGLAMRTARLVRDEREAHVIIEGLRGLLARTDAEQRPEDVAEITTTVGHLAKLAATATLPAITRGWIDCLAQAVLVRRTGAADFTAVLRCGPRDFPEHLRLPLLAQLIQLKAAPVAARRAALGTLLAHRDARVRAAGIGALAALWPEVDDADRRDFALAVTRGIRDADPILAGAAIEAAPALYKLLDDRLGTARESLDSAIVGRAEREGDVELAASLLELIGKLGGRAAGVEACQARLGGHPVVARAAAACLAALGTPAPPGTAAAPAPAPPPPVHVAAVIGRSVRWRLVTSRGPVAIELRPDAAPWAVATIVALTRQGYYDGLELHRVVPDFVVQGGDPTQSGWGGPGYVIPAEPSDGMASGFAAGGIGIADAGRDSGGSQWFIMHARAPHLDGRYTWVGRVLEGQAAADALQIGDRVLRATVEVVP